MQLATKYTKLSLPKKKKKRNVKGISARVSYQKHKTNTEAGMFRHTQT